jgi:hypothetical protein
MPTPTYTPLANVTLGSAASSVTFGSIPNTYRDLIIVGTGLSSTAAGVRARFNADSGTNYSRVLMFGDGSSATSSSASGLNNIQIGRFDGTTIANFVCSIMDYSATDKHKTLLTRYNSSAVLTAALVGRWGNTAAINSVLIIPESGTFNSGSTFALYGVIA